MIAGWTLEESPFHHGEDEVHDRLGNRTEIEARVRRAGIRNYLMGQHREFFPHLPYLAIGNLDANGQPWHTLRAGPAGFATASDAYTLEVDAPERCRAILRCPAWANTWPPWAFSFTPGGATAPTGRSPE